MQSSGKDDKGLFKRQINSLKPIKMGSFKKLTYLLKILYPFNYLELFGLHLQRQR